MIGSWYCLPERMLSEPALAAYRDAGFTHFQTLDRDPSGGWVPYSASGNRRALALCARVGLRCVVVDGRIYRAQRPLRPEHAPDPAEVDAALAEYRDQPALAGYLLYDEPSPHARPILARLAARIRAGDPDRFLLLPLFPMHDDPRFPNAFEGLSYEEYLRLFAPIGDALAFDYYPFFDPARRLPQFVENVEIAARVAREHRRPLWYYGAIVPGPSGLAPTAERIRFQVETALAHGASAIFHFTYGHPDRAADATLRAINREIAARLASSPS